MTGHEALRLAVFVGFFATAGAAIVLHRKRWARAGFVGVFVALLCASGLTGKMAWPFFTWHLYATKAETTITYFEIRVADGAGNEVKLDARAAQPTMATPLNRLAKRLVLLPAKHAQGVAMWLLERANAYRRDVDRRGVVIHWPWKFPRHQSGYQWTSGGLDGMGSFVELRVYRVDARFNDDGTELLSKKSTILRGFGVRPRGPGG